MQVVILAGWLGTRLSEETVIKPKPMVEIGWKPILWHIMKTYSYYGFNEFIICLWYKWYFVKERFANYFLHNNDVTIDIKTNQIIVHNNHKDDRKVTLIDTGDSTMTWWRIKRVKDYIKWDKFMMTYGDGLSDVNIKDIYDFHNNHWKLATLVSIEPENRFWKLVIEGGKVIEFWEKKDNIGQNINWWFMVLDKKVLDYIDWDSMPFEKEPLENLVKDWELMAYKHDWFWFAMDTIKHKQDLEQLRNSWKAPWKIRS
jgi:glucose-1-phosphate cytidylyltransferase